MGIHYEDSHIVCDDDALVIHQYYFPIGSRRIPYRDIRSVKDPTASSLLVRNAPVGKSLATALGNKPVALLRGHGNVVVAQNVQTAVGYAIYTEVNARLQTAAIGLGGPITYISDEEGMGREKNPGDPNRGWEFWKQKALGK